MSSLAQTGEVPPLSCLLTSSHAAKKLMLLESIAPCHPPDRCRIIIGLYSIIDPSEWMVPPSIDLYTLALDFFLFSLLLLSSSRILPDSGVDQLSCLAPVLMLFLPSVGAVPAGLDAPSSRLFSSHGPKRSRTMRRRRRMRRRRKKDRVGWGGRGKTTILRLGREK